MTQLKPFIIVNRLIVTKGIRIVYDENFHHGVNIIRGKNSSGKSTIADFIFYALGGELSKWKEEASSCSHTYIEVNLSGKCFTFRREVRESSQTGMDIIAGTYDSSKNKTITDWLRYPYSSTENKESFYQIIFKELGIPYSKSEGSSSLTLHQLLRLMYVDQMTSLDRLFKFDRFDNANKRKAIGELLIGLSDLSLYQHRVRLQRLDKDLTKKIDNIGTLHKFFGSEIKTADEIDSEIFNKTIDLENLEKQLKTNRPTDEKQENKPSDTLRADIKTIRDELRTAENRRLSVSFELTDSERFVSSLLARIEALEDTSSTIDALSNIGFKYCPSCFQETHPQPANHCCLCGTEALPSNEVFDPTFKIRKEIEFQLFESNSMISLRQQELVGLDSEIERLERSVITKKKTLETIEQPTKNISQEAREILIRIGTTTKEIDQLTTSKFKFSNLYDLYKERDAIQVEFNKLSIIVTRLEASLVKEMNKKKEKISNYAMSIVRADLNHEEAFNNAKNIEFDFGEDRVSVDNRVLFSASSMVFLKNAFRLALLEASCRDSSFLYPRFLLMDNVEDKGMEPERSHTFQKEIIRVSSGLTVPHQIIFTTSMIDKSLNNSDFCIGDFYNDGNKTLKVK